MAIFKNKKLSLLKKIVKSIKLKSKYAKDTLEVLKMRGVYGLRSYVMRNYVLDIKVVFCKEGTFSFLFQNNPIKKHRRALPKRLIEANIL